MDSPKQRIAPYDFAWLLACILLSSIWCCGAAWQLSATWDEPTYIRLGLERWRTGSIRPLAGCGTMPLPVDVTTLPLYLAERWRGVPWDPVSDLDTILPWARTGTLAFWWILLLHGYLLARRIGGAWAGRLAVGLLACEPTLLAHASLATTDLALSACVIALVYYYEVGRDRGFLGRIVVPGLWLAATLLAKVSGLAYGPLPLLAVEIERAVCIGRRGSGSPSWFDRPMWLANFKRFGMVWLVALPSMFLYAWTDAQPIPALVNAARSLPDGSIRSAACWLAEHFAILNRLGTMYVFQFHHNGTGHGTGCYGLDLGPQPYLLHFPLTLSMKLGAPVMVLTGLVLLRRPRAMLNAACLAAIALLLFSLTARIQLGVRLVLPAVALGVVGVAVAWARAVESTDYWRGPAFAIGSAGLAWMIASACLIWPNGLCYANELWGGSGTGFLFLGDSNYDWGQGLNELRTWQRQHNIPQIDISYFGPPDIAHDPGHCFVPDLRAWSVDGPTGLVARENGRTLAVSTTLLYAQGDYAAAQYLRKVTPVGQTRTFVIFQFR